MQQGRLARAGRADQGDDLAGAQASSDGAAQHRQRRAGLLIGPDDAAQLERSPVARGSLIAQRLDRIELRRPPGGIDASPEATGRGPSDDQRDLARIDLAPAAA